MQTFERRRGHTGSALPFSLENSPLHEPHLASLRLHGASVSRGPAGLIPACRGTIHRRWTPQYADDSVTYNKAMESPQQLEDTSADSLFTISPGGSAGESPLRQEPAAFIQTGSPSSWMISAGVSVWSPTPCRSVKTKRRTQT